MIRAEFACSGTVVLVSGATGALGTAVSRAFHAAGARLLLTDRREHRLREAFADLLATPATVLAFACELTDASEVEAAVAAGIEHFGRIDVLVNVAGAFRGGFPLHRTPAETWETVWSANALSVIHLSRAVIPRMLDQGCGHIINVASRSALAGEAGVGPYSASKAAVVRLTEAMAAELKGRDIRVNCVLPGTLDTPANRRADPDADFSCWVDPGDLARTILYLASDAARPVHGAALAVYGLG